MIEAPESKQQESLFFKVPHGTIESEPFKKLRTISKYLYCYLAKLQDQLQDSDGWFWRPMPQLSYEVGVDVKTLKRAKKELLAHGFIAVRRRKYKGLNRRGADYYTVIGLEHDGLISSDNMKGA